LCAQTHPEVTEWQLTLPEVVFGSVGLCRSVGFRYFLVLSLKGTNVRDKIRFYLPLRIVYGITGVSMGAVSVHTDLVR
jgi:hypothetical protein